jgi:hypothetical protein
MPASIPLARQGTAPEVAAAARTAAAAAAANGVRSQVRYGDALIVTVVEARDLKACGERCGAPVDAARDDPGACWCVLAAGTDYWSGKSDPYCILTLGSGSVRTTIKNKQLAPKWCGGVPRALFLSVSALPRACPPRHGVQERDVWLLRLQRRRRAVGQDPHCHGAALARALARPVCRARSRARPRSERSFGTTTTCLRTSPSAASTSPYPLSNGRAVWCVHATHTHSAHSGGARTDARARMAEHGVVG